MPRIFLQVELVPMLIGQFCKSEYWDQHLITRVHQIGPKIKFRNSLNAKKLKIKVTHFVLLISFILIALRPFIGFSQLPGLVSFQLFVQLQYFQFCQVQLIRKLITRFCLKQLFKQITDWVSSSIFFLASSYASCSCSWSSCNSSKSYHLSLDLTVHSHFDCLLFTANTKQSNSLRTEQAIP
jgi:hypothetical protein